MWVIPAWGKWKGQFIPQPALPSLFPLFHVTLVAPVGLLCPCDALLLLPVILCSISGGVEVIQRLSVGAGLFDDFFSVLVLLEEGRLSEGWVTRSVTGLIHTLV